jgi:hypothetical protein
MTGGATPDDHSTDREALATRQRSSSWTHFGHRRGRIRHHLTMWGSTKSPGQRAYPLDGVDAWAPSHGRGRGFESLSAHAEFLVRGVRAGPAERTSTLATTWTQTRVELASLRRALAAQRLSDRLRPCCLLAIQVHQAGEQARCRPRVNRRSLRRPMSLNDL